MEEKKERRNKAKNEREGKKERMKEKKGRNLSLKMND